MLLPLSAELPPEPPEPPELLVPELFADDPLPVAESASSSVPVAAAAGASLPAELPLGSAPPGSPPSGPARAPGKATGTQSEGAGVPGSSGSVEAAWSITTLSGAVPTGASGSSRPCPG